MMLRRILFIEMAAISMILDGQSISKPFTRMEGNSNRFWRETTKMGLTDATSQGI